MKTWKVVVEFTTSHILQQKSAERFWSRGDRFHRTAPQQYEWTAYVDADDLHTAMVHVMTAAVTVVRESGLTTPPEFVRSEIERAVVLKMTAAAVASTETAESLT